MARPDAGVFINVPFDRRYKKLFDALVFAVHDCGFVARGAREAEDGSQIRLEKLYEIIRQCLILERLPHRSTVYCSDIAGQDIRAHSNDAGKAVGAVRDWLRTSSGRSGLPGARHMADRYVQFRRELPAICRATKLDARDVGFLDYRATVQEWVAANP